MFGGEPFKGQPQEIHLSFISLCHNLFVAHYVSNVEQNDIAEGGTEGFTTNIFRTFVLSSNFSVIVNINLPQMLRKAKQTDLQHRQFEVIRLFQFAANFSPFVIVGLLLHVLKVIG